MVMTIIKIVIQHGLASLNEYTNDNRGNRFNGAKTKRINTDICQLAIMHAMKQGAKVDKLPLHMHFKWIVKNKRKDPDNIAFAKKFILDGMVKAGLIKNDGWSEVASFQDEFEIGETEQVIVTLYGDYGEYMFGRGD